MMKLRNTIMTELKTLGEILDQFARKNLLIGALGLGIAASGATTASAAAFLDDFNSDTSANYVLTDTYGSGGAFDISGGTLNVSPGGGNTADVFHSTAQLAAGEFVSIDVPATNDKDYYLTVSTINRGPNTGTEDGIRFNISNDTNFRSRTYRDGVGTTVDYASADAALDLTLYVLRDTATEYRLGYDAGAGLSILDSLTINETSGAAGLFVGIEGFSGGTRVLDNLQISAVPEPGTAVLALFAGITGIGLRRKRLA